MNTEKLVVIGQGYVGLPLAIRAVEAGLDVVGLDVDADRVKRLASGESFVEDIPATRLGRALASGRYRPSTEYPDAEGFDICVITVPTPLRDGAPDLSYVEQAGTAVGPYVRRGCTVVLESTTYPGTTEDLLRPLLEAASGLRTPGDFHLGYSPERIDPGNPTWRLENTPKVVSGVDEASLARVDGFYRQLVERTVPVDSTRVAELTKLIENTFRQVNIALINELAMASTTSVSTPGRPSRPPRPSRSGSCRSVPGRASAGTACRSIRATCPGRSSAPWADRSGSSSWPTT